MSWVRDQTYSRERTETTSSADEHPVNEDMDVDDLLKNWKAKKKTKRNS
jgi:hypothetical protein